MTFDSMGNKNRNVPQREEQIKLMIKNRLHGAQEMLRGHKVLLFGSRAAGHARPRSDFDLGILGNEALPLSAFYKLEDMLDDLPTLYTIELVDLNRVSEEFRQEALKHAEVLYG